jgi:Secretion system C-terminal sorting domain
MKNKTLLISLLLVFMISFGVANAQDIEVIRGDSVIYGSPGQELILYAHVKNISNADQVVFLVRTQENLPANWTSSLCFGDLCFPPTLDSVATDAGFTLDPVHPGDTIEISVHFNSDPTTMGTGHVQIQLGTMHNPDMRETINETASTEPDAVDNQDSPVKNFKLMQNYPNPFNPTTRISYVVALRSSVTLKVYNITGKEVATLVNEVKNPGSYSVHFDGENLSSGVYFYKFTAGQFNSVKKMILIK